MYYLIYCSIILKIHCIRTRTSSQIKIIFWYFSYELKENRLSPWFPRFFPPRLVWCHSLQHLYGYWVMSVLSRTVVSFLKPSSCVNSVPTFYNKTFIAASKFPPNKALEGKWWNLCIDWHPFYNYYITTVLCLVVSFEELIFINNFNFHYLVVFH